MTTTKTTKTSLRKQPTTVQLEKQPERTFHDYEPSNIWTAYVGNRQRWRRMNEWFSQFTKDERESDYTKNMIKPLNP